MKTKDMSLTANEIRVGDRIIQRPTWPDGRLVVDVSNGPIEENGRWNLRITFEGDDEPRTFYRSDEPVLIRRHVVSLIRVTADTVDGGNLFVGEYTPQQYEDMGGYGCEQEARDVCVAAGVPFKTMLIETL